jgi:acetyltransferase-like isoleucine patch superfamily enzyme
MLSDSLTTITPVVTKSVSRELFYGLKNFAYNALLYIHNNWVTWVPSHWVRRSFLRHFMHVELGQGCSTLLGLRLYTRGEISIGDHSVIDRDCVLDGRGGISIGANVNLAPEVMVLTAYHDPDSDNFVGIEKGVVIEDHVWIATRAMILPGVTIGRGAVVGAGSVVTKDVQAGTIVAGNPARFIRDRKGSQSYQVVSYARLFH